MKRNNTRLQLKSQDNSIDNQFNVIKPMKYILNDNDFNRTNIIRILHSEFRPKQTEHLTGKQTHNEKK